MTPEPKVKERKYKFLARCIPLVAAKGKTLKQSIVICSIIYEQAPTKTPKNTNFQKK